MKEEKEKSATPTVAEMKVVPGFFSSTCSNCNGRTVTFFGWHVAGMSRGTAGWSAGALCVRQSVRTLTCRQWR